MPRVRGRVRQRERRTAARGLRPKWPRAFLDLLRPTPRYRYYVYYGGRGSGKSHQVAQMLLFKAHQHRRRILCTREFQTSIRDSVHQLLKWYIEVHRLGAWFEVKNDSIVHSNGSEFLFKGLRHNIGEIKSLEAIDLCWVEEAQAVSAESWDTLVPTIRRPGSEIWITFNPLDATDPTYERYVAHPPASAIVRHVTWRDNPWFPDVLKEEMRERRRTDPEGYEHIWEGQLWKRSKLSILSNWRTEDFTPDPTWSGPYYGLDFGFSQDPLVLVRAWIGDNVLYLDYAHWGREVMNDDLRRLTGEVPGAIGATIRADSSRPETIAHMNASHEPLGAGAVRLRVQGAEKWAGSVEDGIAHLQSYKAIVVHPRCELALREFRLWRFEADKLTGDPLRKPHPKDDNVADALRYAIEPIIKLSAARFRPTILSGGQTPGGKAPQRTTGKRLY